MKQCPFCFKITSDETQICRSCGKDLSNTPTISSEKVNTTKKHDDNWENDWDSPDEKQRVKKNRETTVEYSHYQLWVGIFLFLSFFIRPTEQYELLFKEQYFNLNTLAIPALGIFLVVLDLLLTQIFLRNIVCFAAMGVAIYISPPAIKFWTGLIEFSFGIELSLHLILFLISISLLFTLFLFTSRKGTLFASVAIFIFLLFFYFMPTVDKGSVLSIMRNRDDFFVMIIKLLPLIMIIPAFFIIKIRVFLYLISFGSILWLFGIFYFLEKNWIQSIIFLKEYLVLVSLSQLTAYYIYSTLKI
ncbi:hypothetical protein JXR93_13630 [bacterium]|nr:hypothetical protein [bacterium]